MNGNTSVSEDKLFFARLGDMRMQCERGCGAVYSSFLDERQCAEAERFCSRSGGGIRYALWGGFDSAQRKMLCMFEDYAEAYAMDEFPMKCLTFSFRKEDRLTHRDFLGSFMALRLKRESVGDIIIAEGKAQAFVTEVAASLICSSVEKIGRIGVKISSDEPFSMEIKQDFEDICGTAASMRLDCIVAIAAKVSRENASRLIRGEKITVNHFSVTSLSHELHEGDIISVRGSGRYILDNINGITKKGRIHIKLRKYK